MYFKNFIVFGISHKNLNLKEREEFILNNIILKIEKLFLEEKIKGYVNLSTCLRVEYYLDLDKNYSIEKLKKDLNIENIFIKNGHEAVNYLFRVTCGFESVIKGEDQILAQIKKAKNTSTEMKVSSSNINVIFNKAIELGKKFRNKSKIAHNALSLEAISLKFIKLKLKTLQDKKILILGVGDLAKDIMGLLKKEEYKSLTITNRSYHKALEVKDIYNAEVISFENKLEEAVKSNIIISATSAPHIVIKKDDFIKNMDINKKYIFLDLAVPRDIEEGIEDLPNVDLYNIDDVWGVYYENLENRENLLHEYEYMLGDQMLNLKKWFEYKEGIA
ncbi:glutamyl-tRNA reductase [uncultured Cetobacterium sp.]|uniref:glutamyl-tRNA reductase n=1 Tax=uncultured Cetobacterium sp. TaxID=527638 RepID=UPI00260D8264|nr:glutamyl-tRNA reductase [uncultured Cetobacterium sp.]